MVNGPRRRRIAVAVTGVAFALLCVALVPTLVHTTDNPYARMVRNALGTYHEIHGSFPATLQEIDALIDGAAEIECDIKPQGGNLYQVTIRPKSSAPCVLDVVYSAGADGTLEEYDVRISHDGTCD